MAKNVRIDSRDIDHLLRYGSGIDYRTNAVDKVAVNLTRELNDARKNAIQEHFPDFSLRTFHAEIGEKDIGQILSGFRVGVEGLVGSGDLAEVLVSALEGELREYKPLPARVIDVLRTDVYTGYSPNYDFMGKKVRARLSIIKQGNGLEFITQIFYSGNNKPVVSESGQSINFSCESPFIFSPYGLLKHRLRQERPHQLPKEEELAFSTYNKLEEILRDGIDLPSLKDKKRTITELQREIAKHSFTKEFLESDGEWWIKEYVTPEIAGFIGGKLPAGYPSLIDFYNSHRAK